MEECQAHEQQPKTEQLYKSKDLLSVLLVCLCVAMNHAPVIVSRTCFLGRCAILRL